MEAFKLLSIGALFCYAKNGIEFFETIVAKFLFDLAQISKNPFIVTVLFFLILPLRPLLL